MQPIRDVNLLLRLNHFVVLAMPANLKAGIASAINSAIRKNVWAPDVTPSRASCRQIVKPCCSL